jgi:hypothetical protein
MIILRKEDNSSIELILILCLISLSYVIINNLSIRYSYINNLLTKSYH